MQQISIDNVQKYFIFGIKFDDIYIPLQEFEDKNNFKTKIFIYEKIYLFISNEPLYKLFLKLFNFILNYKKLNFCKNLVDFNSLTNNEIISRFNNMNQESVSIFLYSIIYSPKLLLKCLILFIIKNSQSLMNTSLIFVR